MRRTTSTVLVTPSASPVSASPMLSTGVSDRCFYPKNPGQSVCLPVEHQRDLSNNASIREPGPGRVWDRMSLDMNFKAILPHREAGLGPFTDREGVRAPDHQPARSEIQPRPSRDTLPNTGGVEVDWTAARGGRDRGGRADRGYAVRARAHEDLDEASLGGGVREARLGLQELGGR